MFGGLATQNDLLFVAHAHGTPRVSVVNAETFARELTIPIGADRAGIVACAGLAISPTFVIHVADPISRAVHRISTFGQALPPIGGTARALPVAPDHRGELAEPVGVAADARGNIYTVSAGGARVYAVQKYSRSGTYLGAFRAFGVPGETFTSARSICSHDERIFVADTGNACVHVYKTNSQFLQVFSTAVGHGERSVPVAVTTDQFANLWILERGDRHELRKFTFGGEFVETVLDGNSIDAPVSVAISQKGNIFILDQDGERLRAFSKTGSPLRDFADVVEEDVFIENPPRATYRRGL